MSVPQAPVGIKVSRVAQTWKLESAKSAVLRFTDMLALPSDHVAVIGFSYRADVAQQLSDDRTSVRTAIRSIRAATGALPSVANR